MKVWIISIAAVIILTSCAEMLLPSGKIKNACRTVFAILCMAVVIKPIAEIANFDLETVSSYELIDNDTVEDVNFYYRALYASGVKRTLIDQGYSI